MVKKKSMALNEPVSNETVQDQWLLTRLVDLSPGGPSGMEGAVEASSK